MITDVGVVTGASGDRAWINSVLEVPFHETDGGSGICLSSVCAEEGGTVTMEIMIWYKVCGFASSSS